MSSEGPYGRQGFQSNPSGYGGGANNYSYGGDQPAYGGGQGYGDGGAASYGSPPPQQQGGYGGGVGMEYNPYGSPMGGEYEVRQVIAFGTDPIDAVETSGGVQVPHVSPTVALL